VSRYTGLRLRKLAEVPTISRGTRCSDPTYRALPQHHPVRVKAPNGREGDPPGCNAFVDVASATRLVPNGDEPMLPSSSVRDFRSCWMTPSHSSFQRIHHLSG
jgi:hypothetical protein